MIAEPSPELPPGFAAPPVLVDGRAHADVAEWTAANPNWEQLLYTSGSMLFRGFPVVDPAAFDVVLDVLMRPSLEVSEETSPRTGASARSFTSTDYPQRYPIQFHHEFSYRKSYPDRLAFYCLQSACNGGATPLADSRQVLDRMPSGIVDRFADVGITYIRNFTGLGVSWETSFGTTDKSEISDYCDRNGIDYRWSWDDLHTRQTASAIITHPVTGERAWFNSVLNLNVLGINPESVRKAVRSLPADAQPINTVYGSGDPIEEETLETIRRVYAEEAFRFDWRDGDLLLIDNVLTAHGRDPYEGERRVIVGMGSALSAPAGRGGSVR